MLVAATTLALSLSGRAAQPDQYGPYLSYWDGSLARTRLEIGFQTTGFPMLAPPSPHVTLVQSGVPADQAQRVPVRLSRGSAADMLVGYTTRRLVAERTYDLVVSSERDDPVVLPSALTAQAPLLTIDATPRARGERVAASIAFGSGKPRFRVGSRPARVTRSYGGGQFEFEIPRRLSRDVAEATVTVATAGTRVTSSVPLPIVDEPGAFSAVVDGTPLTFTGQSYFASDYLLGGYRPAKIPQVYVSAMRRRRFAFGVAAEQIVLRVPLDPATATFPVTLTGADGVVVSWESHAATDANGENRNWLDGPLGYFRGTTEATVTLDSLEGSRLKGTFSAHLVNAGVWGHNEDSDGREFDIKDGTFEVDPSPTARAAN
jgi:hypothetical protein